MCIKYMYLYVCMHAKGISSRTVNRFDIVASDSADTSLGCVDFTSVCATYSYMYFEYVYVNWQSSHLFSTHGSSTLCSVSVSDKPLLPYLCRGLKLHTPACGCACTGVLLKSSVIVNVTPPIPSTTDCPIGTYLESQSCSSCPMYSTNTGPHQKSACFCMEGRMTLDNSTTTTDMDCSGKYMYMYV